MTERSCLSVTLCLFLSVCYCLVLVLVCWFSQTCSSIIIMLFIQFHESSIKGNAFINV